MWQGEPSDEFNSQYWVWWVLDLLNNCSCSKLCAARVQRQWVPRLVMGMWRHFSLVLIVAIFGEMMQNVCSAHSDLFPFSMLNINWLLNINLKTSSSLSFKWSQVHKSKNILCCTDSYSVCVHTYCTKPSKWFLLLFLHFLFL